ncbi:MAG: TRAP transporter TatT component family protein, partial [Pseudomonadota bacterium]
MRRRHKIATPASRARNDSGLRRGLEMTNTARDDALTTRTDMRTYKLLALIAAAGLVAGCGSFISGAASDFADNLGQAVFNQPDPGIVRDGAPSYLLLLDSLLESDPENPQVLAAASELYAAYGVVFADDPERAKVLTRRARNYGERAVCRELGGYRQRRQIDFGTYPARAQQVIEVGNKAVRHIDTGGSNRSQCLAECALGLWIMEPTRKRAVQALGGVIEATGRVAQEPADPHAIARARATPGQGGRRHGTHDLHANRQRPPRRVAANECTAVLGAETAQTLAKALKPSRFRFRQGQGECVPVRRG